MDRNKIRAGDIGFSMSHNNTLSKIIAGAMGSRWSHAFLVLYVGRNRIFLLETSSFQVVIGSLDVYLEDPSVSLEIWSPKREHVLKEDRETIIDGAWQTYGTIYGYLQLVSLGIRRLFMFLFNKTIANFIRSGLVCSHVVLYGYTKSRVPELEGIDPESIDTEELYQIISESGSFSKVLEKPRVA